MPILGCGRSGGRGRKVDRPEVREEDVLGDGGGDQGGRILDVVLLRVDRGSLVHRGASGVGGSHLVLLGQDICQVGLDAGELGAGRGG